MGYLDNNGLGVLWKNIVGKSIPYGYCQTAAGTKAKVVTVSPAITALETGMTIAVRFQYANTVASPTLNVNGLGAKSIYRYGTTAPSTSAASSWNANAIHTLTYNGSGWVLNNWNNSIYSSMSVAEYEAGTSGTARLITPARLKGAIQHWATGEANVQSDWGQTDSTADDFIKSKPTIPSKTSDLTNDSGFITGYTETDPAFTASPAYGITAQNITSWNNKVNKSGDVGLGDMMFQTGSGIGLKFQGDNVDKVVRLNGFGGAAGYNLYFRGFDVGVSGNNPVSLLNIADPTSEQGAATKKYVDDNKFSGSYTDLTDKPTIPTKTSDLTNDSGFLTQHQDISGKVSKSGDTMSGDLGFAQFKSPVWNYNVNDVSKQVSFGINGTYSDGTNVFSTVSFNDETDNLPVILGNVATPQNIYDATNKRYVDAQRDSRVPNSRKINNKALSADITLTASDVGALSSSTSIPTKTSDLTNDSGFITSFTETDPVFTASPAYSITDQQISDWNNKPSLITVLETGKNAYVLNVNGSTATLIDYKTGTAANFFTVFLAYTSIQDCFFGQVINGASDIQQAQARLYELAELDMTTQRLRLVSVDNGVAYTADLQDTGSGLTGTFSSQTIGTLTTETDPTVPAWAKASTKPSYTASEVGALATTGGQLTGDLTLYVASGNSPGLIFQRGTLTDNYNDWKIYDKGGYLYFAQRGSGSSAFGDVGYIDTGGVLRAFTIPWGSVSGKPTFATVATSGSYNDLSDKPTIPDGLPSVTTADNGKVLRVVNGAWSAVALPSASGVSF